MKILNCSFTPNGRKQVILSVTTMHVIHTNVKGNSFKKLPYSFSQSWKQLKGNGYSIQYPKHWCLDNSAKNGLSFVLFSQPPVEKRFRENVNLLIQDLTGQEINLDKFVKKSEEQIIHMLNGSKILESERVFIYGIEYHKVRYTGKSRGYDLEFLQYYRLWGNKAYILTLACEISQFKKYHTTAKKIMESFRLAE